MSSDSRKRDWFSTEDNGSDDELHNSDSEDTVVRQPQPLVKKAKKSTDGKKPTKRSTAEDNEEKEESRVASAAKGRTKRKGDSILEFVRKDGSGDEDDEDEDDSEEEQNEDDEGLDRDGNQKGVLRRLSTKELEDNRARIEKSGVVYLSRIPPYMKPAKVRQILSRFGELDRVFLAPEDPKAYARRVRFGGNKKRNFVEGWIEFKDKKKAKLAASTLNGNIIGGRKGSYYYDDILNIKYLPKFKWHHLTEQIAYENQSRQAKLRAEISQATRENKAFIRNVERAKMIEHIQEKKRKKQTGSDENMNSESQPAPTAGEIEMRRNFRQRSIVTNKDKEETMQRVLKNIFA
ncbi:hypothetical protein POJ06DRAFT_204916 [Lipomyces tetrasporus]|uniref:Pre-rRNA-processing protein ESF2 n=1 Tax=Lipomyces tetrasporus TaxID=54092 RepID=A0AAD7QZ28_9ASCO|nr:uncharacterized protein POJ06DRAFT_204916 [Lipomyces tetrasporus]KAJ8104010.1 hypothetical protein POJ06DRAFT_204916 [Lipomyces tetrasporus]